MSKSDDIVIFENPQRGTTPHPLLGVGLLKQIDITSYPGVARLNKATSKASSTTVTNLPYWIVRNPVNGDLYALDSAGQVYKSTTGGASWATVSGETSPGSGQGLVIWKGYLLVAKATVLDAYDLSSTWSMSFATGLDATNDFHTMIASIDDNVYITCGRYVAKLTEASGQTFSPTNSATFTLTARAITLAKNYNAKCLADLGANLMVGTYFGTSTDKVADIFPYNRSTLTLGIPIRLGENGVHQLITVGNRLYAIAGVSAKIFITDGSSALQVGEIPDYAIGLLDTGFRLSLNPGAIIYHRGKILFGLDNSGPVNGNVGVWSFNLANKQMALENLVSSSIGTGNDGSLAELAIGCLFSTSNDGYLIGWKDFSGTPASGIDLKSSSSFITSYGGVIETSFPQIGQALHNRTIQSAEVYLTKPLLTSQGVRLKYRKDLTSSFTTLATIDYATYSGIQFINVPASSITNAVFLQFRIELTSGGSDSPELVRVILKPSA